MHSRTDLHEDGQVAALAASYFFGWNILIDASNPKVRRRFLRLLGHSAGPHAATQGDASS